jgi:hypothetical protein
MTKTIEELVRELEAAEDDAGANGHTNAAHQRILDATEAIRAAVECEHFDRLKRHAQTPLDLGVARFAAEVFALLDPKREKTEP